MNAAACWCVYVKCSRSVRFWPVFLHGFAFEVDAVAGVNDPVQDGIGDGRIVEISACQWSTDK